MVGVLPANSPGAHTRALALACCREAVRVQARHQPDVGCIQQSDTFVRFYFLTCKIKAFVMLKEISSLGFRNQERESTCKLNR